MQLTNTGKVNFDGEVLDKSVVCSFCYKIFLWSNSKVRHEKLHADINKHNQIMKSLYDKDIIVKIDSIHSPVLDKVIENIGQIRIDKSVEIPNMASNDTIIPIFSLKNEVHETKKIEDNSFVFSFNCTKCPEKFLSSKRLRNHICKNTNTSKNYMDIADIGTKEGNNSLSNVTPEKQNSKHDVFNVENKCQYIEEVTEDKREENKTSKHLTNSSEIPRTYQLICNICDRGLIC